MKHFYKSEGTNFFYFKLAYRGYSKGSYEKYEITSDFLIRCFKMERTINVLMKLYKN